MTDGIMTALRTRPGYIWIVGRPAAENYHELGTLLAANVDLFQLVSDGVLVVLAQDGNQRVIEDATALDALIKDRINARTSDGKDIPKRDLSAMLQSDVFSRCYRPVDIVTSTPLYLPDWQLTQPGYNEGDEGYRIFYGGPAVEVADGMDTINSFLDVMDFKENADRTNAVALALTIRLRNRWPGRKPMGAITGNKTHSGKDTVRDFAVGVVPAREISWEAADWAVEQTFEKATRWGNVGVVSLGNVRAGAKPVASAFVERFITDPHPMITSTKTREVRLRPNRIVVTMTANQGRLSADLMNRALPIRLEATGDVRARAPAIGNPREEFLPANRDQIEAELHGMIGRWRESSCPLDESVRHPMSDWAKTVGGILKANGFDDFLANYGRVMTEQEAEREALAILGASAPDRWLRSGDWVQEAENRGLTRRLMSYVDQENFESERRRMGIVLSAHRDETFQAQTDSEALALQLQRGRRRTEPGEEAHVCYRFEVIERCTLSGDENGDDVSPTEDTADEV